MPITSPITGKPNVKLEKTISRQAIIDSYKRIKPTGVDVSRFFNDTKEIKIYRCLDSGYLFYYPLNIAGDDKFYQELEKFPWYYMDWKWEHQKSFDLINVSDKVLEIGCAHGVFLERLKNKGAIVTGLEMNSSAIQDCQNKSLNVYADTIQNFSQTNKDVFDTVCSFQVLEHVTDVKSFIESALQVLKHGGQMIISVPNNESFMLRDFESATNFPPHHMGLWNINSLISLQNYFGMKLQKLYIEPLQPYHVSFAKIKAEKYIDAKLKNKFKINPKLIKRFITRLSSIGVYALTDEIIGHSLMCVYKKK